MTNYSTGFAMYRRLFSTVSRLLPWIWNQDSIFISTPAIPAETALLLLLLHSNSHPSWTHMVKHMQAAWATQENSRASIADPTAAHPQQSVKHRFCSWTIALATLKSENEHSRASWDQRPSQKRKTGWFHWRQATWSTTRCPIRMWTHVWSNSITKHLLQRFAFFLLLVSLYSHAKK